MLHSKFTNFLEYFRNPSQEFVVGLVFVGVCVLLVLFFFALSFRAPPEYGPDEITRDPADPTVTTIARCGLVTHSFYEDGVRVAQAKTFGLGDRGIVLQLKDDPREMLMTTKGDWFEKTRFWLKPGVRLRLLVHGEDVVEAERLELPGIAEVFSQKKSMWRYFQVETAQGRFYLARLGHAKFALLRGDAVVGIAAMPMLKGIGNRRASRIELPGSLPLETRVFLALLVKLEDEELS